MKKLCVCLPLYDGKLHFQVMFRLRQEERIFREMELDWEIEPVVIAGCSLIHHARNELAHEALHHRKADAIMWIDGDIVWQPGAIARLIVQDVDVVGAACPRKMSPITWNVHWLDATKVEPRADRGGMIEVASVGTGFLYTTRRVYEILAEKLGAEHLYSQDGENRTLFFECIKRKGEDVVFCSRWRDLVGGKVWVDPAIEIEHIAAPGASYKARLGDWLKERSGDGYNEDALGRVIARIREGRASPETWTELYEAWGNGAFSGTPDFLAGIYDLAKLAGGPVLECGSGISSLVMGLANPGATVHALEHDPAWLMRIQRVLAKHGVNNVKVHIADIEDGFYVVDMLPEEPFAMAVLDGPPRHIGNRAKAYERLASRIDGAILAVDDTNDPHEAMAFRNYIAGRAGEASEYGNQAKKFSFFIPAQRQTTVSVDKRDAYQAWADCEIAQKEAS